MAIDRLQAGDICTREVVFVYRSLPIDDAARLMREKHVGTVVVVDEMALGRVVAGMLTDRDIVTAIIAKGLDPTTLRVEDAMSTDLVLARESDSLMDLLGQMRRKGVRRLPVADARGVLVGLVSLDDVLEVVARQLESLVGAMRSGRRHETDRRP
jgi:CBS domain-containing protein